MLALLIYACGKRIPLFRRIERATYCDNRVRFMAPNLYTDHDTVAVFRRSRSDIEAAFLRVRLLARSGLLRRGTVSADHTKVDTNACRIRSVRFDRIKELRARLARDIAGLMVQAEVTDNQGCVPQASPEELWCCVTLKAKLDACARPEAEA